ncbi:hydrogenase maturation nickel metallochaperone HypA/HybF [Haloactinomyces albus]|uniref:Hydrogenase maturation factor HypA n=1 Tax=Haloactinomyces albus TaxID=1352928 RepID=A0AAE3ZEC5_9ACTN|nr:hydrogenase maturation nickel metallochaperone HypA [Haloactinomyces albus]MDR7303366.1 hydrogenase nickel incorporation protein HypA/HybF [Haloactinomyces albus]
MHELGITQSIVEAVLDVVEEPRITRLQLEIGRLSGVVPDSVRFCFDLVAEGTALDGAQLDIVEPEGRGSCRRCGAEFEVPDLIVLCPCGSADVAVLEGRELRVRSVEVP